MGIHEKLLQRFLQNPKDFTWDELVKLLGKYNYFINNKGKTSGSRVVFENDNSNISLDLHRPHPRKILKPYQMKNIYDFLLKIKVIDK